MWREREKGKKVKDGKEGNKETRKKGKHINRGEGGTINWLPFFPLKFHLPSDGKRK